MDNVKIEQAETISANMFQGFIKIWQTNPKTGESELLVDKPNTILYQGADILSLALAGRRNSGISHMYVGFCNDLDGVFTKPTINKEYSNRFQDFADPFGYLRLPLAFPASFLNTTNYENNISIYTTVISASDSQGGATFQASSPASWIYEIALVAATEPADDSGDMIFSRANFNAIQYATNYNLTISWGVKFQAS